MGLDDGEIQVSAVYPLARQRVMEWILNGNAPTDAVFYAIGVDDTYVYSESHELIGDVLAGSIVAPAYELVTPTVLTGGYLDAADILYEGLDDTDTIEAIIIYVTFTGGSLLMAFIDQATDGSLPQPIDSTKAAVYFNALGIFRL